ncbi:putative uncharacterized protein DDB_G0271606 [Vidua macroura]|uniref:putative uncharacterized protein DDB_G0271606 n=1 Tax=Vidua macroura TaxID=187451 RepID=UPI0023A791DC|nr:putative uncharacterized protein DDB_G0271606 [Vidua macroura]
MTQESSSTVLWERVSPSVLESWPTNVLWKVETHLLLLSVQILPEKEQEQIELSEMPCQTQGELRAREQEEQLRQQVEEPQENGQNIKAEPQAELPEAQSAITEVKKRNQEETRRIQKEMNLHQQRGDQQNQVTERVAVTPLVKDPLSRILENLKEQLDTDFQKAHAKIMAREKRQEEEMKIIREKLNPLPQALQKQVSERGIATAVTKLVVSALLAFPVQSSRERGDASECHPALVCITVTRKDISWCAESQLLPWTVGLVLWPFGQQSSKLIPAGLFLLSLFLEVFLQGNMVTQMED